MNKREIELAAQLAAIEHLVTNLYALNYLAKGYSPALVKSMHKLQIEQARQDTFPTANPALSDHAAAEFENELSRLLHAVESKLAAVRAK